MHARWRAHALWAALLGAALTPHTWAQTSPPRATRRRKPPNRDKGPAETRQERDARLQRECRGKPNSGACEGYGG